MGSKPTFSTRMEIQEIVNNLEAIRSKISIKNINLHNKCKTLTEMKFKNLFQPTRTLKI